MSLATEYPSTNDCMELQNQLEKLTNLKTYYARNFESSDLKDVTDLLNDKKAKMKILDCDKKNLLAKNVMIDFYVNKYTAVDKDRIEPESISQARKRIIVGGGILVLGLGILFIATQKK